MTPSPAARALEAAAVALAELSSARSACLATPVHEPVPDAVIERLHEAQRRAMLTLAALLEVALDCGMLPGPLRRIHQLVDFGAEGPADDATWAADLERARVALAQHQAAEAASAGVVPAGFGVVPTMRSTPFFPFLAGITRSGLAVWTAQQREALHFVDEPSARRWIDLVFPGWLSRLQSAGTPMTFPVATTRASAEGEAA